MPSCAVRFMLAAAFLGGLTWSPLARAETDSELCARTAKDGNIEACERAVAQNPRDLSNRKNLAFAFLAISDSDSSFRVHREIVALAPDDPDSHFGYAAALATFRQYEPAIGFVRTALQLNPDDSRTLQLAFLVFELTGQDREAFAILHRGARLGDLLHMFDLALYYGRGRGTPADPEASFRWLERAAEKGHVTAMQMVSEIYLEGRPGIAKDETRAAYWADRAGREAFGN